MVDDVIAEVRDYAKHGYRTLVTVLTKKMAEDLTEYMHEQGLRVRYMHSDIDTIERIEIIRDLRLKPSTPWSASTCCARASTSPSAQPGGDPRQRRQGKASCARRPA